MSQLIVINTSLKEEWIDWALPADREPHPLPVEWMNGVTEDTLRNEFWPQNSGPKSVWTRNQPDNRVKLRGQL